MVVLDPVEKKELLDLLQLHIESYLLLVHYSELFIKIPDLLIQLFHSILICTSWRLEIISVRNGRVR